MCRGRAPRRVRGLQVRFIPVIKRCLKLKPKPWLTYFKGKRLKPGVMFPIIFVLRKITDYWKVHWPSDFCVNVEWCAQHCDHADR